MTLGERLRKYLPDGVEQKVVAMNWIERIEKAGMRGLSSATVPSRLCELLADDPQGVRTFFRDPRRANALFDELNVPEDARAELRALAEPILAGAPQPRLVVDVSDLGADRVTMDAAFAGMRQALFGDDGVFPVALVLTDAQYDLLPRSFDRFKDRMQIERVADAAAGADAATRLAGDSVCVVSQRPVVELARWWAASVEDGALLLEPEDGLTHIRSSGSIGLPEVTHPLAAASGPPLGAPPDIPAGGVARRRLVVDLADETSTVCEGDPGWRRAVARELGVQASSTERERVEEEIAGITSALGMEVRAGTPAEWEAVVARAARRPTDPVAMRVGDHVRVLNPTESVKSAGRLEVARIACAEPHLVMLERALAEWTEDDLFDDPLLGRLIHRLAADNGLALKLLLHARAVIVLGGRLRLKPTVAVNDPLGVLAHLLASEPPEASLRVRTCGAVAKYGSADRSVALSPFVYPGGKLNNEAAKESGLLYGTPPSGDVTWRRGTSLRGVLPATGRESTNSRSYGGRAWDTFGNPPALVDPSGDAAAWLDDVEASAFFGGTGGQHRFRADRHLPEPEKGHAWVAIPTPDDLWLNADTNLALAWLAVQDSLGGARSIRLPDGSVILQVGGGLAARIRVRRHGDRESEIRAAVRCNVEVKENRGGGIWTWTLGDLAAPVTTHVAHTAGYTTRLSVLMPSIWLSGRGFAADVSFIPAPMLPGGGPLGATLAAAAIGAVAGIDTAQREAELQAMYDDDD